METLQMVHFFFIVESGILGFGNGKTAQEIRNPTNDWNPESTFHCQRLESRTWIWNPRRIQDCLGFPYKGRLVLKLCRVAFAQEGS